MNALPNPTDANVWGILNRLLTDLGEPVTASEQILQTLEAVREAVGADAVCWYDEATGETLTPALGQALRPDECEVLTLRLLAMRRKDTGRIAWRDAHGVAGDPCSVAAVRVHRARPSWVVAVSCRPARIFNRADGRLIALACGMLVKQRRHTRAVTQVKESLYGVVHCLSALLDAKDACTAGHSERVGRIAVRLGQQLGLTRDELGNVRLAGMLHDIGKIGIRDEVLLKPGSLTEAEYRHICEHPVIGDQIVATIKPFVLLRSGVRHHHERWDGRGYPDALAGDDIPLLGRILAVADACDAMMSARRYRNARSPLQVSEIFLKGAGTQWDPELIDAFMACSETIFPPIYQNGAGGSSAEHAIDSVFGEF